MYYKFTWKEEDHSQVRFFTANNILEAMEKFTIKYYSHMSKLYEIKLISNPDEIEYIIANKYAEVE